MQAVPRVHTQKLPACGTAPLLPGGCHEGREDTRTGGFQILPQVLSILCDMAFVQIFDAPTGVFRTITTCRSRVAISLATNAFSFRALETQAGVTDDTVGSQAVVFHSCSWLPGVLLKFATPGSEEEQGPSQVGNDNQEVYHRGRDRRHRGPRETAA